MKVSLIRGRELSDDILRAWQRLRQANPDLRSPYFHPEFTRIMASTRHDVEISVLETGGEIVGLFPFHRERGSIGRPVGGMISDYQGIICAPDFSCDPRELVRACCLKVWGFDHLIVSQRFFAPFHVSVELSPQLDLSDGFETYYRNQKSARSKETDFRNIQRNLGPLRFVAHSTDERDFDRVIVWKSQQYVRTGGVDIFLCPWIRESVQRIHATQDREFAGCLSLLYAGESLVAGHIGLRSESVLHSWFPAYNPTFGRYSPGLLLLLKMAEHAQGQGIRTIDLGKGMTEYKQRFMNASCQLANGSVELRSMRWLGRTVRRKVISTVARSFPGLATIVRRVPASK
jgi:CelD/BcsL family acetyltransferase involved in cellulose biosynthesis